MIFIFLIIYIFFLYRLLSKSFEFEELSRFEYRFIPIYSAVMWLLTMDWSIANIGILIGLAILSFVIGSIQARRVQFRESPEGKVMIRKGLFFLIGWDLIIATSIILPLVIHGEAFEGAHLFKEVIKETEKDLFVFSFFSQHSDWYIWALTLFTNISFTFQLGLRNKKVWESLKRKKQR